MDGCTIKLFTQRVPGTVAAAVIERQFHLPAWSESLVQVSVSSNLKKSESLLVSAEPSLGRHLMSRLLVASCRCSRQANCFSVSVLYFSDEAIDLPPHEPLAKVETVQFVESGLEKEIRTDDLEAWFPLDDIPTEERRKLFELL